MKLFSTILLFIVAHVGVAGFAAVSSARAQNSPDCTACALECSQNAQQCRDEADIRFRDCISRLRCRGTEECTAKCRKTHRSELSACDRQESGCIGNCYI